MACTGKFFEGNAAQMWESLSYFLHETNEETDLFYGHEYSFQNLQFAIYVEPENEFTKEMFENAREILAK